MADATGIDSMRLAKPKPTTVMVSAACVSSARVLPVLGRVHKRLRCETSRGAMALMLCPSWLSCLSKRALDRSCSLYKRC